MRLLLAIALVSISASVKVYFVTESVPLNCPGQPCFTLNQYTQQATRYFTTGSTFVFLPGNHGLQTTLNLSNVSNIILQGDNYSVINITDRSGAAITCKTVTNFTIERLRFIQVSSNKTHTDLSMLTVINCKGILISNSTFQGLTRRAIYSAQSNVTIINSLFEGNTAHNGGAICALSQSNITLTDNLFARNVAINDGGAIYANESFIVISSSSHFGNISRELSNPNNPSSSKSEGIDITLSNEILGKPGMPQFLSNEAKYGGALYLGSSEVHLEGSEIMFVNNTARKGGAVYMETDGALGGKYSVFTSSGGHLYFVNNTAHYLGSAIYASHTTLIVGKAMTDSHYFVNNSGGDISYQFGNLTLMGNSYFKSNNEKIVETGGAISVNYGYLSLSGTTLFYKYRAEYGGAIFAFVSDISLRGIVEFRNNRAQERGGGVFIAGSENPSVVIINWRVLLAGTFVNNIAKDCGGAVSGEYAEIGFNNINVIGNSNSALCFTESNITFYGSTRIANNTGKFGGGIKVKNSHLSFTKYTAFHSNKADFGGAIYAMYGTISAFHGITLFTRNTAYKNGGALYALGTEINSNIEMNFSFNFAQNGGAMYIRREASLNLQPSAVLITSSNNASAYGGGIYYDDNLVSPFQCSMTVYANSNQDEIEEFPPCFIHWVGERTNYSIQVRSYKDSAGKDGNFLYGGLIDKCQIVMNFFGLPTIFNAYNLFKDQGLEYIEQLDNNTKPISSQPYQLCFCGDSEEYNCSKVKYVKAVRGENWRISLIAIDQMKSGTSTSVAAVVRSFSRLEVNQSSQNLPPKCTNLTYTVYSEENFEELVLYPDGPCRDTGLARAVVHVTLLPCPDGFIQSGEQCVCEERLQPYDVHCIINEGAHIVKENTSNFWLDSSYSQKEIYQGLILSNICPEEYCKKTRVVLTLKKPDFQCDFNRSGILCGACANSLMLGSSRCEECSNTYLALLLPFAAAGIALVVFLSILRLTVATGMINSIILYANILQANRSLFLQGSQINILTVFVAWLNFDLGFETCFYDGMTAYAQTWLQFAFPLYTWMLMSLITVTSRYSINLSKLIGHNPVAVLATLLLMSYTKILKIIIDVYSSVHLYYPNNRIVTVWLRDANVPYLQSRHLLLTVVASLVLVFLFLPYTLLLLMGYKLYRFSGRKHFRWINRIKPLLDSYYAPYKIHTRYWTGFLLLVRCALYIVFSFNSLGAQSKSLLAINTTFTGIVITAWLSAKIYKTFFVNVLEASIYLNLVILSAATLADVNSAALVYSLIGIVFITMIGIIVYHFHITYTAKLTTWTKLIDHMETVKRLIATKSPDIPPTTTPANCSSNDPHRIITKTVIELREPLLEGTKD